MIFLLALPLVYALDSEYYIKIKAGNNVEINETIKFYSENWFMDKIYLIREDANNIKIYGVKNNKYKIVNLGDIKIIEVDLEIPKGKEKAVKLSYIIKPKMHDDIKVFEREFFSNVVWRVVYAEIEIKTDNKYSFGKIFPRTQIIYENNTEKVVYKLNRIDNFTELTKGFEVIISYGDYMEKALYEIKSAEEELSDVKTYSQAFNVSVEDIELAEYYLKHAYGNFSEKKYYNSYLCAKASKNLSKEAMKKIILIKELREKEFKEKIEKMIKNLTKKENNKTSYNEDGGLTINNKSVPENKKVNAKNEDYIVGGINIKFVILLLIGVALLLFVTKKFIKREKETLEIPLKEREYSGFDVSIQKSADFYKKITNIKKIDVMADKIFNLKKEKRELEKKLKNVNEEEKEFIIKRIDELNKKILELEKELERAKKWRKLSK